MNEPTERGCSTCLPARGYRQRMLDNYHLSQMNLLLVFLEHVNKLTSLSMSPLDFIRGQLALNMVFVPHMLRKVYCLMHRYILYTLDLTHVAR